jgi:hypothetical protein
MADYKQQDQEQAIERIKDKLNARNGRITWTIELGRGETYSSGDWTIYAHDSYPRSSVLSGRERRTFIWSFDADRYGDSGQEAAIQACKAAGVWKYTSVSGSTHVPIEQIVSHLPDDTDY